MGAELLVPLGVVIVAATIAAVTDLWRFKVYNLLTIPLLLSGLVYHAFEAGLPGLSRSAGGALFGIAVLLVPYLMGGMGAGDLKLMSGVGAWLGFSLALRVVFASAIAAGLYGLVVVLWSGRLFETWINLQILWLRLASMGASPGIESEVVRTDRRRRVIPFAAMVAVGVIATALGLREAQSL